MKNWLSSGVRTGERHPDDAGAVALAADLVAEGIARTALAIAARSPS